MNTIHYIDSVVIRVYDPFRSRPNEGIPVRAVVHSVVPFAEAKDVSGTDTDSTHAGHTPHAWDPYSTFAPCALRIVVVTMRNVLVLIAP